MPVNKFTTALMPISQAVCWYLVLHDEKFMIFDSIFYMASFYCLWAIYNRLFVTPRELGFISTGVLAAGGYLQDRTISMVGLILVEANFAIPASQILGWRASQLAHVVKKDDKAVLWAHIFKLYFISNMLLWSVVLNNVFRIEQVTVIQEL